MVLVIITIKLLIHLPLGAETYWSLVTNVPHILSELTWELITGVVGWGIGKGWLKNKIIKVHDKEYHQGEH